MTYTRTKRLKLICCALVGGSLLPAGAAHAEEHGARVPLLPKYVQECAACHLAYPPGLLPAASWQRLMADLPHHFGTDASLDAAALAELSPWLQAHAGSGKRAAGAPPQDRITKAAWFVREHREVAPAVWQRKAVASAAHCEACHTGAASGRFSEHDIHIPQ